VSRDLPGRSDVPARRRDEFSIDGTTFVVQPVGTWDGNSAIDERTFFLPRPRPTVDRLTELITALQPRRILEFGIYRGGSVAWLSKLTKPIRHVAVELSPQRQAALDRWIASEGLESTVRTLYGVDQGDADAVRAVLDSGFGDDAIDLVFDDASHLYTPTRTSFNLVFPRLRPGGIYIIEDWAWLHIVEQSVIDGVVPEPDGPSASPTVEEVPISAFVMELVLAAAYHPSVVAEVLVDRDFVAVTRGERAVDEPFDLTACSGLNGRAMLSHLDAEVGSSATR
jgi:predicted O-methyltransferase YrrM